MNLSIATAKKKKRWSDEKLAFNHGNIPQNPACEGKESSLMRLRTKDLAILALSILIGLASLFVIIRYRTLAFPQYAIDFKLEKEEITERAGRFLEDRGVATGHLRRVTIFSEDQEALTYLDQELGSRETAALAPGQGVWLWKTRFFKELEKEEFIVSQTPDGQIAELIHVIPENAPGAKLTRDEALAITEKFLSERGEDTVNLALIGEETKAQPGRLDHSFIFEDKSFKAKEATSRISVTVQGDQIGIFAKFLNIPDDWLRDFAKRRSQNETAQAVAEVFLFILGISTFVVFIKYYREKALGIKKLIPWLLAGFVVTLISGLNLLPILFYGYDTTSSFSSFTTIAIAQSVAGALFITILLGLALSAGTFLYNDWKNKIYSPLSLPSNLLTKQTLLGLTVGSAGGIFIVAFTIIFYFLGKNFNFWVPAEVPYSDIFSTFVPWIYALHSGFIAATTEEFLFRLFAIPFLSRLLKSLPLAILLSSAAWGFGHSSYPQEPWFARGVEVSIIGVGQALLFLRFGILAPLITHYGANALETSLFLYNSGNLYIQASTFLSTFLPALGALGIVIYYARRGKFKKFKDLALVPIKKIKRKVARAKSVEVQLPGRKGIFLLLSLSLISIALLFNASPQKYGSFSRFSVPREEAIGKARDYLSQKEIDVNGFRVAVRIDANVNPYVAEYALEKMDIRELNQIHQKALAGNGYIVRFFKIQEKEEYVVFISSAGAIESANHTLPEKAPGPVIAEEDAEKLALNYLTVEKKIPENQISLLERNRSEKEQRVDYSFTYEDKTIKLRDLNLRYRVEIIAGKPWGFSRYFKIPEDFTRARSKTTLENTLPNILTITGLATIIILAIVYVLTLIRKRAMPWGVGIKIGLFASAVTLIARVNELPLTFWSYPTEWSLSLFTTIQFLTALLIILGVGAVTAFLVSSGIAVWRDVIGKFVPDKLTKGFWAKTALIGIAASLIEIARANIFDDLVINLGLVRSLPFYRPQGLDTTLPIVFSITSGASAIILLAALVLVVSSAKHFFKRWAAVFGIIVFLLGLSALSQPTRQEMAGVLIQNIGMLAGVLLAITLWFKNNPLAIAVWAFTLATLQGFLQMAEQGETFIRLNGGIGLALISGVALAAAFLLLKGESRRSRKSS